MHSLLKRDNLPNLAYVKQPAAEGNKLPMIVFLGGFRSDMQGTKAIYLEELCREQGRAYVRFDYRGHGQSEGKFEEACISDWVQDASDIVHECTSEPVILVGSSMGGWISLLLASKEPKSVAAFIGLAAAPDFTTWMESDVSELQIANLQEKGYFLLENDYDSPYVITKKLLEDGRQNTLLDKVIDINLPVRLIQGKKDTAVPWEVAKKIKNAIKGDDVAIEFLENADHRLSAPNELALLKKVISELPN
jgi:pimeloyl-ACP methyl ester carboxylesterase